MYIYASIGGDTKVVESFEVRSSPINEDEAEYYVLVDAIHEDWIQRKRWNAETQSWEDVLPSEAVVPNSSQYTHKDINGIKHWLDDYVNDLAEDVAAVDPTDFAAVDHTHTGYAASSHTHTDNVTVQKTSSPHVHLSVSGTNCATKIYKNATSSADYGTVIADFDSAGDKDSLILRRSTGLTNKLYLSVLNDDDTTSNYYLYGEHHKPTASEVGALAATGGTVTGNITFNGGKPYASDMYLNANGANTGMIYAKAPNGSYIANLKPCNENGNCVVGWGNYDCGEGDTNIYGKNVHIYALNSDGSEPAGAVFVARNSNNHTLINNEAHLTPSKISDTYIYGRAVHIDTNDTNFIVDSIQLAHTDKATISSFSSGWASYGSGSNPTVRRYGKIVSLTGALKNTTAVTLNTTHVQAFTIPSGYRPSQDMIVVCQGSGANKYLLQVKTDGTVSIGRYGTTSFIEASAGSWFPFHVTWVME